MKNEKLSKLVRIQGRRMKNEKLSKLVRIQGRRMKNGKYTPINCSYYDELEAIATLRKSVEIVYYENEQPTSIQDVQIKDLFTKNKEEFVVLSNGMTLRLDYLISVDGKAVIYGC